MRTLSSTMAVLLAACLATLAHADSRFVEVRGNKLYVETVGDGPPLLFLHGGVVFFDNNFAAQRDYFSSFRRVIGVDRRGHGHSPDNAQPFSYKEMAEDMAALIVALGVAPVDVVGHSDGANVGLILARDHPGLVRRLVISGANLKAGLPPEELAKRAQWPPETIAEKAAQMAEKLPPAFRPDYEKVAPDGAGHWPTLLAKSYRLWLTPVIATPEELNSIEIPVLVMAGDHDFTSIEETVVIYRSLPKGQLAILPGTAHGTFSTRPELANLLIREFLERP
jgi:pimeloyl-ACP methyl ester carboxylesterase